MKYPHPCNQCGFCCLVEACPVAQMAFKIGKHDRCPALRWEGVAARCGIVVDFPQHAEAMGMGAGCCIAARVLDRGGAMHDFASLPGEAKIQIAQLKLKGKIS